MSKIISRLNIIKEIDDNTPDIVIEELCKCHNIIYNVRPNTQDLMNILKYKPIGYISTPLKEKDWEIISRYVNPDVKWIKEELDKAYNFLIKWEENIIDIPLEFNQGLQTPSNLYNLNACVLYKICKFHNIKTYSHTTLYQLYKICDMLTKDEFYIRRIISQSISMIPYDKLFDLYLTASDMSEKPDFNYNNSEVSYTELNSLMDLFFNKKYLTMRILPCSNTEAIILSALNFNIDISKSTNSALEYREIFKDPNSYKPIDEKLKKLVKINPHILNLKEYFNPMLPSRMYNEEILIKLAEQEGYTEENFRFESPYSLLQTSNISSTFYHGKQIGITNKETPFLCDTIDDLDNESIVCYGVRSNNKMVAYKYVELAYLFRNARNFINPLTDNDFYESLSILKLKKLCKIKRIGDSSEVIEERDELYKAILTTELFTKESNVKLKKLYEAYTSNNDEIKNKIKSAIWNLFYLSMYMRGWLGDNDPFPIEKASVENQNIVDLNVTENISLFMNNCENLGDIGNIILDLPLLKYYGGDFIPYQEQGKTLLNRLNVVIEGEDNTDGYDSCIRLSSNLFAVSSYRYMEILDITPPFNVNKLRDIS